MNNGRDVSQLGMVLNSYGIGVAEGCARHGLNRSDEQWPELLGLAA